MPSHISWSVNIREQSIMKNETELFIQLNIISKYYMGCQMIKKIEKLILFMLQIA